MRPRLRLFGDAPEAPPPSVPMPLSELVEVLRHATASQRAWLDDFADDELLVGEDLAEVVRAYRAHRRAA